MPKLISKSAYIIRNVVCLGSCYPYCWFDTSRRLYPQELKLLNKLFNSNLISYDSYQDALIFNPVLVNGLSKYQKRYLYKCYTLTFYYFACREVKEVLESELNEGEMELYRLAFANFGIDFVKLRHIFSLTKEWDIFNYFRYEQES